MGHHPVKDFVPLVSSFGGTVQHFMRQNDDGTLTFATRQDVNPILEMNHAMATHDDGYNKARDQRRVASIPLALIQQWKHEEGWDPFSPACADKLAQKLNDPDYAYLRTAPGRLGVSNGIMR